MKPATMKGLAIILFMIYFPPIVENMTCEECGSVFKSGEMSCIKIKEFITCLESTLDTCSGESMLNLTTKLMDEVQTSSNCIKQGSTCACEQVGLEGYVTEDDVCMNSKYAIDCLRATTDAGCTDTRAVAAAAYEEQLNTTCLGTTTTCRCEIAYTKADVTTAADQCTAAKTLVSCLQTTKDIGCSISRMKVGTFAETKTNPESCLTTEVCDCEIAYGKADITNSGRACTEIKTKIACLTNKTSAGCDGTSYSSVALTSRQVLAAVDSCSKTDTCICEIHYANADLSTKGKQCSAANIAKECLQNITSTTEVGCDGSSKTVDIITNFTQPLIDAYCGAASLNGVGLTVGILVMLLEMTR